MQKLVLSFAAVAILGLSLAIGAPAKADPVVVVHHHHHGMAMMMDHHHHHHHDKTIIIKHN